MICTNLAKGKEWGGHGCVAMGVANAAQSSEAEPYLQTDNWHFCSFR